MVPSRSKTLLSLLAFSAFMVVDLWEHAAGTCMGGECSVAEVNEESALLQRSVNKPQVANIGHSLPYSACPFGYCPGMGNLFYLGKYDTSTLLTGGTTVLRTKPKLYSCINYAQTEQTAWNSATFDSMEALVKKQSADLDIGGSFAPAAAVSLSLTVKATTGQTSTYADTFHSVNLQYESLQGIVNYDVGGCLTSPSVFTSNFISDFHALPLIYHDTASHASSWEPYSTFLQFQGSHMMVSQRLGSSFQQWTSSDSQKSATASELHAKACAKVEGLAIWNIGACMGLKKSTKKKSLKFSSTDRRLIRGGTQQTRNLLAKNYSRDTLDAFIDSSGKGDAAIGYGFRPIWEILLSMYRPKCEFGDVSDYDSDACKHVQRALNLQAAYEGWISIQCSEKRASVSNGVMYQRMEIQNVNDAIGNQLYQCWNHKVGCLTNSDCHYKKTFVEGCYCYGETCFNKGDALPGGVGYFTGIQTSPSGNDDDSPNPSCQFNAAQSQCSCDANYNGGLPSRAIYLQDR